MKRILLALLLSAVLLSGCGAKDSDSSLPAGANPSSGNMSNSVQTEEPDRADEQQTAKPNQPEQPDEPEQGQTGQTAERINEEDPFISAEEANAQTRDNIDTEMTTDELLDLFINGSINAISSEDSASAFYITDLDMDSEEWDSYSIGERVDLDNDGENELIIYGPYGGIYLDARDGKVYEFAVGEGDSLVLSYVVYNGSTWVMYSNRMHTGYEAYHMEKFEGADNLVAEMNFDEKLVYEDNVEGKEKYTLNGTEISYDEYFELCSKIFAAEETTTK